MFSSPSRPAGSGIRVAIIDSGVHASHPHVLGVAGGAAILADGSLSDDYVDRLGHGTAVAGAIREKAPGAELYAVRIFDRTLSTSMPVLCAAVRWSLTARMQVINLSLGTANPAHEAMLLSVVSEASAAGAVIVAAREDGGTRWWPGSLPGVLSVRADASCPRETFVLSHEGDAPVVTTSPYPRPIPGVPPERNLNGVSFAVANVSGFLARALVPGPVGYSLADAVAALERLGQATTQR